MKTVIEILSIEKINNQILSDVRFIEGNTMLINDEFKYDNFNFKIENVGISESEKQIYPLIIEFNSEVNDLQLLIGVKFLKEDKETES